MKGMLLAAGRGSRLRPLTDHTPKALVKVAGHALIERHIQGLAAIGVSDIVINLHHLGEQIANALGSGARYGVRLHFLHESTLLETGGGITNALHLLDDGPFIVISADIWTDYPLAKMLVPLGQDILARLILVRSNLGFDFGFADTPTAGNVAPLIAEPVERFDYGNLCVLDPALFRHAPSGAFPLRDLLFQARDAGQLEGEIYSGPWFNIGSAKELQALQDFAAINSRGDSAADKT